MKKGLHEGIQDDLVLPVNEVADGNDVVLPRRETGQGDALTDGGLRRRGPEGNPGAGVDGDLDRLQRGRVRTPLVGCDAGGIAGLGDGDRDEPGLRHLDVDAHG